MATDNSNLTLREDDMQVHSTGRFTVPKPARQTLGVGAGDPVRVAVIVDGEHKHFTNELDTGFRVRIPPRMRSRYGIEDGDNIDVEVSAV